MFTRKNLLSFITFLFCANFVADGITPKLEKFSAVNPGLVLYRPSDIVIIPPVKYKNGMNIITPNPQLCPWESRLENGMPNVIVDEYGNTSIYLSSFVAYAEKPPSKVGALVYTNNTQFIENWKRPDAGLFWFDPKGSTGDAKIKLTPGEGFLSTNIVAVDIESVGIFDDYSLSKQAIKLIYLPQRESHNSIISGYQMDKKFDANGILQGFSDMKYDRQSKQKNFMFNFINGDTHMGYLKYNNIYSFVSRLNAKRSFIRDGETLPFRPDARKRYRRETWSQLSEGFESQHVDLNIALDMSTPQWEPYSMQPMQFPEFNKDIWWGLVTMFGTEGDPDVQHKQRTELAISCDGKHWRYLKPGTPFLDNGADPTAADAGCINIAIPVNNTKFSSDSRELFYFYAASNLRHVTGRNPGVSLATGRSGKWAALHAEPNEVKDFRSPIIQNQESSMPQYSLYRAMYLGSESFPRILADVTTDPTGKTLDQMRSYAAVLIYAYDSTREQGLGDPLCASLGMPQKGTLQPSDNYEVYPFMKNGMNGNNKEMLFNYLRNQSRKKPSEIISVKELAPIPVVVQTLLKNTNYYGVSFTCGNHFVEGPLNLENISDYKPKNIWSYKPIPGEFYTIDFSNKSLIPNEVLPVNRTTGTVAIEAIPKLGSSNQMLLRMYAEGNNNDITFELTPKGEILYTLNKDGSPFAQMTIEPPIGKSFENKKITILLEVVPQKERKYGKEQTEDVALLTLKCPEINYEKSVPQSILWSWKHPEGQITDSDRANARAFAFLEFSSFVPGVNKITVGAVDSSGKSKFSGNILKVQVADKLPNGNDDFWPM